MTQKKKASDAGFGPNVETEVITRYEPSIPGSRFSALAMVLPLFFLSGATSLVLENLWTRAMVTVFGSSQFATSTVLATFMGGMALGSFIAGRLVDRVKRLNHLVASYGLLQGAIGLYALALPWLIAAVEGFNVVVWTKWQPSFYVFSLLRFGLVAALLLLPTTCMGATLPILSRYVCESREELGKQAGTLYAVNTFGAVAGTFAGGFLLMPALGMRLTNITACTTNLLLCVAAVSLAKLTGDRRRAPEKEPKPALPAVPSEGIEGGFQARLAVWGIGISGAVAMVYQVAWTRTLSLILGSSVYAFALILICFLLGLAAGGALYARRTADKTGQLANLSVIHIVIAVLVLIGLLLTDRLPPTFLVLMNLFRLHPTSAFASKFLVSAALMLAPTFCMGMIFPATVKVASEAGRALGWTVGSVYATNTVGSIIGSFLGGFVLIPYVGLQFTVALMILVNVGLAVVFGGFSRTIGKRAKYVRLGAAVLAAAAVAIFYRPWNLQVMVSGVFRISVYDLAQKQLKMQQKKRDLAFRDTEAWKEWKAKARKNLSGLEGRATSVERLVDSQLVFYEEGVVTTVSVTRSIYEGVAGESCWETLSLQVNGKADASVTGRFPRPGSRSCKELAEHPSAFGPPVETSGFGDTETQVMSGLLGVMLSNPDEPIDWVNVVGWGSGITVGSVAMSPARHIEAVELEREVIVGARWFLRYNHDAENHPRVRIIEGDGRTYLAASPHTYDVIISEPSNPWITGCANLFTADYFELVKDHLKKEGKFVQWLQIYEISPRNVKVILATLASVFPHVHLFRPGFSPADLLLVASPSPIELRYDWLQAWLKKPGVSKEAARIGVRSPEDVLVRSVLDGESLKDVVKGYPINTDDNALVEFSAPKDLINYYRYDPDRIAASLEDASRPVTELVDGGPEDLAVRLAWAWMRSGSPDRAIAELERASGPKAERALAVARWLEAAKLSRESIRTLAQGRPLSGLVEQLTQKPFDESLTKALKSSELRKEPAVGLSLIGFLLARQDQTIEALRFLWASWRMSDEPRRGDTATLLAGILQHLGLSRLAVDVARQTIERKQIGEVDGKVRNQ